MDKFQLLYDVVSQDKTLLGVGPMSWHTIDSIIEIANERQIPLLLIASRRQVESKYVNLEGGYVTDTETLAKYVRERDKGNYVFLCRDHGGPWQGDKEGSLEYELAMKKAKISYQEDIAAGFDILHIDPALKSRPLDMVISDVKKLYQFCEMTANYYNKQILYEVGTEEHSGNVTTVKDFQYFIENVRQLPKIKFVVGNIGLFVKEMQNVGTINFRRVEQLTLICKLNHLLFKVHNADYLNGVFSRKIFCPSGINAINIAPELGVIETCNLIYQYRDKGCFEKADKFIKKAYDSGKWFKWIIDHRSSKSTEYKAMIAGHYIFQTHDIVSLRNSMNEQYPEIEKICKKAVKDRINSYLNELGWESK